MTQTKCPECKSTHTVKAGFNTTRQGKKQKLKCQECARTFYQPQQETKQ